MELHENPVKRLNHNGTLALKFARRGNKTVMVDCYQIPPLRASRELYLNPIHPSEATVYMVESSGSLMAGDENNYQIEIYEGAKVCLIPQSAIKIYPSLNGLWSIQNINISIDSGASLAWKTEAVIPYQHAKFYGETIIQMAKDATLLWGEILTPGRVKREETFQYNHLKTSFQVWMEKECLIYDSLQFSPEETDLKQLGLLENHLYMGSLWFVAPMAKEINMKKLHEELQAFTQLKTSVALLDEKVINVRWLASDMVVLKKEMDKMWHQFSQYLAKN